jgi:hypothetical protein
MAILIAKKMCNWDGFRDVHDYPNWQNRRDWNWYAWRKKGVWRIYYGERRDWMCGRLNVLLDAKTGKAL